ncbi:MAG: type III pantothenate kinase [Nitrosomonadales bacterium]|nr:type III pantothenate kinase [Nitrosomonadales bacterium]
MSFLLLIDAGNSRIKWCWPEDRQRGALDTAQAAVLAAQFAGCEPPERVLVSNVAGAAVAEQLSAACALWRVEPEFIVAQAEQCGIRNTYERPSQLGSDRWAALIAARQLQSRACLVVNCGTATTVDALSGSGEFLGGLILPGIGLMQSSLLGGTAQLKDATGAYTDFPRNTADAIFSGAIQATVGAIRLQHARLRQPDAVCILSGGAVGSIAMHLGLPLERVDDLVLQGLHFISREAR